jgi:hypothetical protein
LRTNETNAESVAGAEGEEDDDEVEEEEEGEEDLAFLLCWCRRNHPRFDMVARCALLAPPMSLSLLL